MVVTIQQTNKIRSVNESKNRPLYQRKILLFLECDVFCIGLLFLGRRLNGITQLIYRIIILNTTIHMSFNHQK